MDESEKKDPPEDEDPVEDLKKGIGLLFRAAKSAANRAKDSAKGEGVEKAVKSSLHEIGRAVGNVAQTIERELRGDDDDKNKKS